MARVRAISCSSPIIFGVRASLPDDFVTTEQREAFYVDLVSTLYTIEQEKARIEAGAALCSF